MNTLGKSFLIFLLLIQTECLFALSQTQAAAGGYSNSYLVGMALGFCWDVTSAPNPLQYSDNNYATDYGGGANDCYLFAQNFNFSIPTTATITGIQVSIEKSASGTATDYGIYVGTGSNPSGINHALAGNWPSSDQVFSYGSSTDLWGQGWTATTINSGFNVMIAGNGSSATINVDQVQVTVYYNSTTPVTFIDFKSEDINNNLSLVWETSEEVNLDHFEVEESRDGIDFTTLKEIQPLGNKRNAYQSEINSDVPLSYYRIKSVDKNGRDTYSEIVVVVSDVKVKVFPNPVRSGETLSLYLEKTSDEETILLLYDSLGNLIRKERLILNQSGEYSITTNGLSTGIYYLQMDNKDSFSRQKISIQ